MIVTLLLQGNQTHLFYSVEYLIIATKIGSKFHDFYMLQMFRGRSPHVSNG